MTTPRYQIEFSRLKVGAEFFKNGNRCKKQSTRTARLVEYNKIFYFGQREKVELVNLEGVQA